MNKHSHHAIRAEMYSALLRPSYNGW